MIGKCKAVGGSSAGMEYLFQDKQDQSKERGYELERNMLIGETPNELISELKQWNADNAKELKNEVFSMVFSPAGDDSKKLSDEQLKQLGKEFIQKTLGINPDTQPYYMRVHEDTNNKHVHIYTPRTNVDGKTISDKHCQYKAMNSADEVAKEHGLTRAKEVMNNNIEQSKGIKEELKKVLNQLVGQSTSWDKFKDSAKLKGINIKETINKKGELQGYRVEVGKTSLKASEVDRKLTLPKLHEAFSVNAIALTKTLHQQQNRGKGYSR